MVAHHDLNKVSSTTPTASSCGSFPARTVEREPLANGNVLITDHLGVREITRHGDTGVELDPRPTRPPTSSQACSRPCVCPTATRLNTGERVTKNADNAPGSAQAIEVTPDKKGRMGAARVGTSDNSASNLGPATSFQFLDPGNVTAPENVHFGDIH